MKFSYPNDKTVEEAPKPVQQAAIAAPEPQATMTADKLHFDWNSKGSGKLLPTRVFDDGASLYLAWSKETPLPAILTVSEDRKEGPVNYRMSGEYIVVSPIPANLVLRYGSRYAVLWPSRRIMPVQPASPTAVAGKMAAAPVMQPQQIAMQAVAQVSAAQPQTMQPRPNAAATSTVKLANVTALYSDQLTDADHEH